MEDFFSLEEKLRYHLVGLEAEGREELDYKRGEGALRQKEKGGESRWPNHHDDYEEDQKGATIVVLGEKREGRIQVRDYSLERCRALSPWMPESWKSCLSRSRVERKEKVL